MVLKLIIFGAACFMIGAFFGVMIMALAAINRHEDDERGDK